MNRKIYKEIARKHGVSIGEVRNDKIAVRYNCTRRLLC
jgi:hypothetical protein